MKNDIVTVDYSVVNRIKIEEIEDFAESLFLSQYEEASLIISEIIANNVRFEELPEKTKRHSNELCNVVSFLGGRGTGKTSAMLSYAAFLRDYNKNSVKESVKSTSIQGLLLKTQEESNEITPSFLLLDAIDASLLGNNEGVLEAVLARMWDYYDQEINKGDTGTEPEKKTQMAKQFSELRADYQNYIQTSKNENISNIKQLHHLAGTLNFRNTFQKFTKTFLNLFRKQNTKYLVLMLDDVDMAGKNSFKILEQIHLFLCVPNIIILLTADLKRLRQICGNYFLSSYAKEEKLLYGNVFANPRDVAKMKDEFANDYLGKIMPLNMRITMPDIREINIHIKNSGDASSSTLSEYLLHTLFKNNIQFDCIKGERHFLEESTLRGNANIFHELKRGEDKEHPKNALIWLGKSVRRRLLDRIENISQAERFEQIFRVEIGNLNKYLVELIWDDISENLEYEANAEKGTYRIYKPVSDAEKGTYRIYKPVSDNGQYSLGDVLYCCSILERQAYVYKDLVNFILAYYTELITEYKEVAYKQLIGRSIWGDWTDSMILNLRERANQFARNSWDTGLNMQVLELEIIVPAGNLKRKKSFYFEKDSKIYYYENALKSLIATLTNENRKDILAFQVMLSFFYNPLYNQGTNEEFFEFSNALHKGDSGKKINKESISKDSMGTEKPSVNNPAEEQEKREEKNAVNKIRAGEINPEKLEEPKAESYKILIKPKTSLQARFNIDYPIMNTEFFENMVGVFEKQLENGLKGQLLDIIGQIVMGEKWAKKSTDTFRTVKKGNKKVSRNDTINSIYLAKQIRSWKKIYPERDYVFPVENIEMTYNIGKTLENHVVRFVGEKFYVHVQDIYVLIKDELEKRDEFYREPSGAYAEAYAKAYSEYPVIKIFFDQTYATALQKMILKIFRPIEQQAQKANQAEIVEV